MSTILYYPDRDLILGMALDQLSEAVTTQAILDGYLEISERFVIKEISTDMTNSLNTVAMHGQVERIVEN